MPEMEPSSGAPPEELSFDKAEFESAAEADFSCSACSNPVRDTYFRAGDAVFCSSCRWAAEAEAGKVKPGGSRRFGKAFLYGLGGAIAGTLVYLAVLWGTGYEVGLIAIVVGWLVGKAVYIGSENTGGRKYQLMAVALTYFSICASYAPLIVQEMMKDGAALEEQAAAEAQGGPAETPQVSVGSSAAEVSTAAPLAEPEAPAPAPITVESGDEGATELHPLLGGVLAIAVILAISMAAPFLMGFENILGLVIIAIGLFEAWKHARAQEPVFEGPFSVGE